jgi:hypothetical protein
MNTFVSYIQLKNRRQQNRTEVEGELERSSQKHVAI